MGRKCCTLFDNESCTSGYKTNTSGIKVLKFPADLKERERWVKSLPNMLAVEDVTDHMEICLLHRKEGFTFHN